MQIEICAFSLASCLIAEKAGADRLELCGGMLDGGTTPSAALITMACRAVKIPVYVMIRPRGGDFCYSANEFDLMCEEINIAKTLGVAGFVFGILLPDGKVDEKRMRILVEIAQNSAKHFGVTFHRAFDVSENPFEALETIIACGCELILTSGQENTAIEGKALLAELVKKATGRIEIMAGSGINPQNANEIKQTGVAALHLTAKTIQSSAMLYRNPKVSMASAALSNEYENYEADYEKIRSIISLSK